MSTTFLRRFTRPVVVTGSLLLLLASTARADYRATILADAPAAYYRLSDWPTNYMTATNSGSGGTELNGLYQFGVWPQAPGALAGETDPSAQFTGFARMEVPWSAALNPSGAFSVECWAFITNSVTTNVYRCPMSSRDAGFKGWILYAASNNRWGFWTGSGTAWVTLYGPGAATNTWVHVVATRDALGTNRLYINGALTVSNSAPTFVPNPTQRLRVACGANETVAGDYFFPGRLDELAFYGTQLSDAQIAAHYSNGTNASRSVPYSQLVNGDGAVGYWRMNEPAAAANIAVNSGTLGSAANGLYTGSPATVWPGQPSALQNDADTSVAFTNATGTAPIVGARLEAPFNPALNPSNFSVEAWAYLPALYRDYQTILSSRDIASSVTRGFALYAASANGGKFQFYTGRLATWNTCVATNTVALNTWNHVVGTYDGTYQFLYVNGELVGALRPLMPYVPNFTTPFRIGAGYNETPLGNYFLNGGVDEAAVYGTALSPAAVSNHYAASFLTPPVVATAPSFAWTPANVTNQIGTAIRLDAVAYGAVPMQYQWYKDGTPLTGQTNFVLLLANASAGDTGAYELEAANGAGTTRSAPGFVQILPPGPPVITADLPANVTVYAGGNPKLEVKVTGSGPFGYQWTSNGVSVPSITGPTFALNNVQPSLSGSRFSVLVTNAYGNAPSATATITVSSLNPASYASVMLGFNPLSYWRLGDDPANNTALDCWGGNNGQYVNVIQHYTPGALGLDDDGAANTTGSGSYMFVPNSAAYNFSGTNAFTLVAWARPEQLNGISVQRVFSTRSYLNNNALGGFGFGFYTNTQLRFTAFGVVDVNFAAPVAAGQWQHLAAVRSGTSVVLYHNGVAVGTNRNVVLLIPSTFPLRLGGNPDLTGGEEPLNGQIDEAAVFGTALTGAQIRALFDSRNGAKPNIAQAPQSITTYAGGTAQFSVVAAGTPPLSYQWKSNGVALINQTNSLLVLADVQAGASGAQYSVTVTNPAGAVSASATLTVTLPIGYAAQIVQDKPVAYWRLDDRPGPLIHDIWGGHEGTTNGEFVFQVPGALFNEPNSALNFDGGTATRVVVPWAAELNPPTFTVEAWARVLGGAGTYRAVVSSRDLNQGYILYATQGNTWQFWTRAAGQGWQTLGGPAVVEGEWVHLAAACDGTTKFFYVNGQLVGSQPDALYEQNLLRPLRIGAGNNEGSASSDYNFPGDIDEVAVYNGVLSPERIALHYALGKYSTTTPPFIVRQPDALSTVAGVSPTFSVQAAGSPVLGYQWLKNTSPLPGATGPSLTLTNVYFTDAGQYSVLITNGAGTITSASASLQVGAPPLFANLTNALVLHLAFEDNAQDTSGRANHGTVVGTPSFVAGRLGKALRLNTDTTNGIFNYVTLGVPSDLQFGADVDFSVAYWVKFTGLPNDLPFLCSAVQSYSNPGITFAPGFGTGTWSYSLVAVDSSSRVQTGSGLQRINDGQWHHLVHTFTRTNLGITYLDGLRVDTRSLAGLGNLDNGNPFNLGQDPTGGYGESAQFDLDDLGIWRRALSEYEALSIFGAAANSQSFDQYGPVRLTIHPAADGVELIWQAGTLLKADDPAGSFTPVPGAASPYHKVVPGPAPAFYRVRL